MEANNIENVTILMVILNALGVVLFAIGMFLLKNFSDKLDKLITNQAKFNEAIAVLQTEDKNKADYIRAVELALKEGIKSNSIQIDGVKAMIELTRTESRDRGHRLSNAIQTIQLDLVKVAQNGNNN